MSQRNYESDNIRKSSKQENNLIRLFKSGQDKLNIIRSLSLAAYLRNFVLVFQVHMNLVQVYKHTPLLKCNALALKHYYIQQWRMCLPRITSRYRTMSKLISNCPPFLYWINVGRYTYGSGLKVCRKKTSAVKKTYKFKMHIYKALSME